MFPGLNQTIFATWPPPFTRNDPLYLGTYVPRPGAQPVQQWHLNNSAVTTADIQAPDGWGIRVNAQNVVVAVIDTGIKYDHEDIAGNMWQNPGEIAANGLDDDGDGYKDNLYGINAIVDPSTIAGGNPDDDSWNGHGTHVAG